MRRPGLALLIVLLIGGLVYWWFGSGFSRARADRDAPAARSLDPQTANQTGRPADRKADQRVARTGADGGSEEREEIPSGPRFDLTGEVLSRPEAPLTDAWIVAYAGRPNDRRLNMNTLFTAIDDTGTVNIPRDVFRRKLGEPLVRVAVAADGSFRLRELPTRHLRLVVEHRFYALDQPAVVHIDPEKATTIVLRPYVGGHVVGRIEPYSAVNAIGGQGPDGQSPVRLIAEMDPMFMIRNPQDFAGYMMNSIARDAAVDAKGRFEFRAVVPSPNIHLSFRGASRAAVLGPFRLKPGQSREVVLHAKDCGTLHLEVRSDGEPIVGARVGLHPPQSLGTYYDAYLQLKETSGEGGLCLMASLLPGRYRVEVTADGYVTGHSEIDIQTGETTRHVVDLDGGASVSGTVVDANDEPVARARIRYMPDMDVPILGDLAKITGEDILIESARGSNQRSDDQGRFTLRGIDDDEPFGVAAWHEDHSGGFIRGVTGGQQDVVIKMAPSCGISGRMVDDDTGDPISHFTASTMVRMMMVIERPSRTTEVAGSEDGGFALTRVPPGSASLLIQAAGFADLRKSVKIGGGELLDVGTLRMKRGAIIRGIVRTNAGTPVPGALVGPKAVGMLDNPMLQSMSGTTMSTSDKQGHFELTDLPPGGIKLKATSNDHASGVTDRMKLAAGQILEGVEIVMGTGGTIVGRLKLSAGMTPAGWMVLVNNNAGGSMRSEMLDAKGGFRFEGIDPGKYNVQAMQNEWMRSMQSQRSGMFRPGQKLDLAEVMRAAQQNLVRAQCRVKDGETTEVVLDGSDLGEDGVALTISVTLGAQRMEAGWVEVEQVDGGQMKFSVIENGIAKLGAVQPGRFRLRVRTGLTMTPVGDAVTITVPKAKVHTARVELPAGSVEGRVVDQSTGDSMVGAVVRIVSAAGSETDQVEEVGFAITDKDGGFRFEGLGDGRYSVFANDSFFNPGNKRQGGRLDNIRIEAGGSVEKVVLRARRAARATVRVADESDVPAVRAMVLAVDPGGKPLSILPTFTDGDGRATLGGLPPGKVRLVAMSRDLVPGFSDVEEIRTAHETKFVVTMSKGPRIKVRVEDKSGKVLPGARLSARWRQGPWIPISLVQRFDAKTGYLDLGHLPAGAVEFRVHSAGAGAFVVNRNLPAGLSAELVFTAPD